MECIRTALHNHPGSPVLILQPGTALIRSLCYSFKGGSREVGFDMNVVRTDLNIVRIVMNIVRLGMNVVRG